MNPSQDVILSLTLALSVPLGATALAQETNRYAATFSLDTTSPGVPGFYSGADIICANSTELGTAPILWSEADFFGISPPPAPNIDAASDGDDVLPLPTAGCRDIWIEYAVSSDSMGTKDSVVRQRTDKHTSDPAGPANDIFGKAYHIDPVGGFYEEKYLIGLQNGVSPLAHLDALVWTEVRRGNLFFSVDPASAPPGVSAADILVWSESTGKVTVWATTADLKLHPDDDIDALAIDLIQESVVFSLAPGSPSLPSAVPDPGTLMRVDYGGGSFGPLTMFSPSLELDLLSNDNLTGVRVADPARPSCQDSTEDDPNPSHAWPYSQFRINKSPGNINHMVHVPLQGTKNSFEIDMLGPNHVLLIFMRPGRPCSNNSVAFPASGGCLSFLPKPPIFGVKIVTSAPVSIPIKSTWPPGTFSIQGVFQGPVSGIHTTNMITMKRG